MIKMQNEGIFCGNVTVGAPIGLPKRFNLPGFFVKTKCVSYPTLRAANVYRVVTYVTLDTMTAPTVPTHCFAFAGSVRT